jgi:hypothetical protein
MKYWKDQHEPIKAFVTLFETCMKDPELSVGMQTVNQVILFDYTQDGPECSFWIVAKPGVMEVGPGKPKQEPDMKKILVKGSATGLLKLAPKLPKVAQIYAQVLKDQGWEDKIVK